MPQDRCGHLDQVDGVRIDECELPVAYPTIRVPPHPLPFPLPHFAVGDLGELAGQHYRGVVPGMTMDVVSGRQPGPDMYSDLARASIVVEDKLGETVGVPVATAGYVFLQRSGPDDRDESVRQRNTYIAHLVSELCQWAALERPIGGLDGHLPPSASSPGDSIAARTFPPVDGAVAPSLPALPAYIETCAPAGCGTLAR